MENLHGWPLVSMNWISYENTEKPAFFVKPYCTTLSDVELSMLSQTISSVCHVSFRTQYSIRCVTIYLVNQNQQLTRFHHHSWKNVILTRAELISRLSAKVRHQWWQLNEFLYHFLWSLTKIGESSWFNSLFIRISSRVTVGICPKMKLWQM